MKEYAKKLTKNMLPSRVYSQDIIGNLCLYTCLECEMTFNRKSKLRDHTKLSSHKNSSDNNLNLTKTVYHKCKLCYKDILCDYASLYMHLRFCHSLSIDVYCRANNCVIAGDKKIVLKSLKLSLHIDNLCTFACNFCKKCLLP